MKMPPEPTAEQCNACAHLGEGWYAIWYPQMGGYVGKAAVWPGDPGSCVEIVVWHDGEFPFRGSDEIIGSREPVRLHHCDMAQFRTFADEVEALQAKGQPEGAVPPEKG